MKKTLFSFALAIIAVSADADQTMSLLDGRVALSVPNGFYIHRQNEDSITLYGPPLRDTLQGDADTLAFLTDISLIALGEPALEPCGENSRSNPLCGVSYFVIVNASENVTRGERIARALSSPQEDFSISAQLDRYADSIYLCDSLGIDDNAMPAHATCGQSARVYGSVATAYRQYLTEDVLIDVSISANITEVQILGQFSIPSLFVTSLIDGPAFLPSVDMINDFRAEIGDDAFFRTDLLDELRIVVND